MGRELLSEKEAPQSPVGREHPIELVGWPHPSKIEASVGIELKLA